jgi:PAT family beta-lactamase induction signal transducer AmpG
VFIFSVTVSVDVQRTGLGTFEQPLLIGTYGLSLSDTAWPPLLRNLAFSVRVLVALLSDLYSPLGLGHRLPFILLGQTLCCAGFLACALYPPYPGSGFSLYLGMALGRSLVMVMAQCALDGLVVDAGVPHLQGVIQQVRATGTMVGVLVTNLGGAAIAEAWGLPALCLAYAILTAPLLPLPMALARGAVEERASGGASRAEKFDCSAFSALRHPHALAVLFLAVATFLGQTIANFPLTVFLVSEKRLTLLDIGALGTISAVTSWPGSLLAGWLLDRQDVRAPIAACQALNAALTLAVLWTPPQRCLCLQCCPQCRLWPGHWPGLLLHPGHCPAHSPPPHCSLLHGHHPGRLQPGWRAGQPGCGADCHPASAGGRGQVCRGL